MQQGEDKHIVVPVAFFTATAFVATARLSTQHAGLR